MAAPDYRLDGFQPASGRVEDDFHWVTLGDDTYAGLAAHHTPDGRHSYLLLYDGAAIWDIPGTAEYLAIHIERDLNTGTFTFDAARRPTVPLTQHWLIHRGCPAEAIEPDGSVGPRPADALTARLEDQLRHHPEGRYTLLSHYTDNPGNNAEGIQVSTLLYDHHPDAADTPYRIFLEETVPSFATYTVREGAFPTAEAADTWMRTRNTSLPLTREPQAGLGRRAAAARARSTTAAPPGPSPTTPPGGTASPPAPSTIRTRGGR
ncbi:hypothetical protein C3486_02210 [Streptomyces sp. Ru73]|uniref:hypothetical protein n=1 Tax=Streptomyces sp. Ru73 TaxID=2080748 RepID=UPI000CDDC97B|nr:hypothetical protein [Streptomyces sp. Ru73]POX43056.1 hypothetical protein C3486_02210 [Streptomyces sp. Ru73]